MLVCFVDNTKKNHIKSSSVYLWRQKWLSYKSIIKPGGIIGQMDIPGCKIAPFVMFRCL